MLCGVLWHCSNKPYHVLRCASSLRGWRAACYAGQAVIQFAKDSATEQPWAIKFFVCGRGFKDEAALYRDVDSPLGPFLPLVRNIIGDTDVGTGGGTWDRPAAVTADAGRIADALGRPLPPCIVMERGESLDIWRMRNAHDGIDVFTALQVLLDILTVPLLSIRRCSVHAQACAVRCVLPGVHDWSPVLSRPAVEPWCRNLSSWLMHATRCPLCCVLGRCLSTGVMTAMPSW